MPLVIVPPDQPLIPPSARELEVVRWRAEGLTNAGAAEKMGITQKTAERHIHNIREKLQTKNSEQTLVRCLELGYLEFGKE